ncbi:MAG: NAD(P)-dependent dehydrogenase (short-subunit alcohol dehydrogenase family) [Crocinitomicaceae bacterium]|jgi:NAD(P)-dependent dehydrogenase (short-subunit alcohol dehydrogenase family)
MAKSNWNTQNIPDQKGKVIVITGASSGLGKEATKVMAQKNATVIMAVRNVKKGESVAEEIRTEFPTADIQVHPMDLGSLNSIKAFSENLSKSQSTVDILINNAGVMMCPYSKTEDGFEIQMGTNHLGHFALTGLLMPLIKNSKSGRIVATSSIGHRSGAIDFEDFNWENRKYKTTKAYGDSKLANLYFTYELSRKLEGETNSPIITAAHPGWTSTDLQRHSLFFRVLNPIFSQKVAGGVLPTLRAAVDPNAKSGNYFGPSGFQEMKGNPMIVKSNEMSHNVENAKRLWTLSEELTGVKY